MAALEPDVEFFGIRIPPNATVSFGDKDKRDDSSSGDDDDDDDVDGDVDGLLGAMSPIDGVALIHATQVALGPNPAPGRHTVMAFKNRGGSGKEKGFPIGTLEVGKTEQFSIDLMWSMVGGGGGGAGGDGAGFDGGEVSFSHTGKSDVFITGYKTVTSMLDNEMGYSGGEEEESDEEDFSSEEEESDDEEAPQGVPLLGPKGGGGGDDFSSSSEEEDEESDGEDSESEEEEEDEDDGGGGRAFLAAAARPPRTPAGVKRPLGGEESSGDDDESESDGSESDDDETDDSEDGDQPSAPPASKKAKQAAGEAPAAAASAAAAYAGALRDFLREHGPTKLGALGAAVRRPAALPKLTTFLAGREDFRVDGEQRVSLVLP